MVVRRWCRDCSWGQRGGAVGVKAGVRTVTRSRITGDYFKLAASLQILIMFYFRIIRYGRTS